MPALNAEVLKYTKRIRDRLRGGPDAATASLSIAQTTAVVLFLANDPGLAGNNLTITVTLPTVTAGLTCTLVGNDLTIALDQTSGTPNNANNTVAKIVAAVNAVSGINLVALAWPQGTTGSWTTAVAKQNLAGGTNGSGVANVQTLPLNFLRAQDIASVLDLYEQALTSGTLTAIGGSSTTVTYNAGAFVAGQQVNNTVTFGAATTTVALRSKTYLVTANTHNTLTLAALDGTPVNGDTFVINGALIDSQIITLRQKAQLATTAGGNGVAGKVLASAPRGNPYGMHRQMMDAVNILVQQLGIAVAVDTLTQAGQPNNTGTVTVNGKVYTFQTVLTNVDGNVHIGTTAANSLLNLIGAINLTNGESSGAGTDYATLMTLHPTVAAVSTSATVGTLRAKTPGTAGNALTLTVTATNYTAGAATFAGGAAPGAVAEKTMATLTTGTGSTTTKVVLAGGPFRIDAFRGLKCTIGSDARLVTRNDETSLTVDAALTSAPSSSTTVTLTLVENLVGGSEITPLTVHVGGDSGEGRKLASRLTQVEAAIVAYVVPV